MTTYRLPAWLGGHEIKAKAHRFTGYGEVIDAVIDIPDGLEVTVSFPAVCVVEVKPPSIDDPVELPLAITVADGTVHSAHLNIAAALPEAPMGTVAYLGTDVESEWLTAEQCRDAARALWKLGTGGAA